MATAPATQGEARYVYRFGGGASDGGSGDKTLLGGKGANLAEMASIGLPVPPGFVLTTAAYHAFVAAGGLAEQILALARLPADAASSRYETAADRIRALFTTTEVPAELTTEIAEAYAGLGDVAVAVRSSATASPTMPCSRSTWPSVMLTRSAYLSR